MLHCSVLYGCILLCNIMSLLSLSFCVICLWACYWNKRTDWLIDSSFHVNNINSQLKISTVFTTGSVTAHCVNSTPVNCGVSRHASGVFRIFVRRKTCYLPFPSPAFRLPAFPPLPLSFHPCCNLWGFGGATRGKSCNFVAHVHFRAFGSQRLS